jgi:hypothetical protein
MRLRTLLGPVPGMLAELGAYGIHLDVLEESLETAGIQTGGIITGGPIRRTFAEKARRNQGVGGFKCAGEGRRGVLCVSS